MTYPGAPTGLWEALRKVLGGSLAQRLRVVSWPMCDSFSGLRTA